MISKPIKVHAPFSFGSVSRFRRVLLIPSISTFLLDLARRFTAEHIIPVAAEYDRTMVDGNTLMEIRCDIYIHHPDRMLFVI